MLVLGRELLSHSQAALLNTTLDCVARQQGRRKKNNTEKRENRKLPFVSTFYVAQRRLLIQRVESVLTATAVSDYVFAFFFFSVLLAESELYPSLLILLSFYGPEAERGKVINQAAAASTYVALRKRMRIERKRLECTHATAQ